MNDLQRLPSVDILLNDALGQRLINEYGREMTIKAIKAGLRVINVPSHEYRRKSGYSRIPVLRWSARYVWTVVRELFTSARPTRRDES